MILFKCTNLLYSQSQEKIRFKKTSSLIYFFQKGEKHDSITLNKGDLFYLIVSDSMKPFISIQVENAQLVSTQNDSLVRLNYVKGMNYESIYLLVDYTSQTKIKEKQFEFKTMVNGVSTLKPEIIEIKCIDKREKSVLLRNDYYFISKN